MLLTEDELKAMFIEEIQKFQSAKASDFASRTKAGIAPNDVSERYMRLHYTQDLLKWMGKRIFGDEFWQELVNKGDEAWRETLKKSQEG
jgi:hypothetical protein